jgi:hypothetical protein
MIYASMNYVSMFPPITCPASAGLFLPPKTHEREAWVLHAYGTPFFIEADLPLPGAPSQSPFRRLMIAQDTGSAIVGPGPLWEGR